MAAAGLLHPHPRLGVRGTDPGTESRMLAFDIETEGLRRSIHAITMACVYDPERGIEASYNLKEDTPDAANVSEFLRHLDEADVLCSFNGARFDIPFIVARYKVPVERYSRWYAKLFDYFEICKVVFGASCSLNSLLQANGIETKTSSGMQAVVWAREKRWKELADYCIADTILTHRVSSLPRVVLPLTNRPSVVCRLARHAGGGGGSAGGSNGMPPECPHADHPMGAPAATPTHPLAFESHAPDDAPEPPPVDSHGHARGGAMDIVVIEHVATHGPPSPTH